MIKKLFFLVVFFNMQFAFSQTTTCPINDHWAGGLSNFAAHFHKHNKQKPSWEFHHNNGWISEQGDSYTNDALRALRTNDAVQINCPGSSRHGRYYGFNEANNVFAVSANNNRDQFVTAFVMSGGREQFNRVVAANQGCNQRSETMKVNDGLEEDYDKIYESFSCNLQPELFFNSSRCNIH